jgi:hypothetical protein
VITTIGNTTSCSANFNSALGSDSRTDVSKTKVRVPTEFSTLVVADFLVVTAEFCAFFRAALLGLPDDVSSTVVELRLLGEAPPVEDCAATCAAC